MKYTEELRNEITNICNYVNAMSREEQIRQLLILTILDKQIII